MSTLFLINPASGRKRDAVQTEALILKMYQEERKPVETVMIDFPNLDKTLEEAINRGVEHIFAVGGDGTVNAIGTRLLNKPVNFGVIPKGSGNGYARNLGFSINTRLAVRQSMDAQSVRVDTGLLNQTPFLNVAGVGLDAEAAKHFSMGRSRGLAPYIKSSAESLFGYKPENYVLHIDGERRELQDIMGLVIANGTQWGYDAKVSAHARLTDGLLDLIIVKKFPLIKVGLIVNRLFSGNLEKSRYVDIIRAKEIIIDRSAPGNAQIDGEPITAGRHLRVVIQEKSLNVLLPNTLTEKKIEEI